MEVAFYAIVALGLGFGGGYLLRQVTGANRVAQLVDEAAESLKEARRNAETITKEASLEAKEALLKAKTDFEANMQERKKEIDQFENRLIHREKILDRKLETADKREREYEKKERRVSDLERRMEQKNNEIDSVLEKELARLQEMAGMSVAEAKEELKEKLFQTARVEAAATVKKIEEDASTEARDKANTIIAQSIQRQASDFVAENTASVVDLPNDEMKGADHRAGREKHPIYRSCDRRRL